MHALESSGGLRIIFRALSLLKERHAFKLFWVIFATQQASNTNSSLDQVLCPS